MAVQKQDDQHEYVRIRDVVLKTYLGRWTIGRSGERGSGISVLPARYDDDDEINDWCISESFLIQSNTWNELTLFIFGLVWFLSLMAYQLFVGYLMPKPFSQKNSSGTI